MPLDFSQQPAPTRPGISAKHAVVLLGFWLAIFFSALFSPPLIDDADSTHAQAARAMVVTGDWVTLHVNGVRYLEKPPLPYWLVACSYRIFGFNAFGTHLPLALGVLALAALGYFWARRAFGGLTAFYTGLATLTCTGVFLFTRIFIPEVLLSLFICVALYTFLRILEHDSETGAASSAGRLWASPYILWIALALAVLTKGFVALVFFFGAAIIFLLITGQARQWRRFRPLSGVALFLLIAAPWHILASLRNTGGENGHGFFWFYFVNEHILRFLGRRLPHDYNKLPGYLYWSLHLVWLFPWSLFAPLAAIFGWRALNSRFKNRLKRGDFKTNSALILTIYAAFVLLFFAFSTNQEYYTFPIYLPVLILICAALVRTEQTFDTDHRLRRWLLGGHIAYTVLGLAIAGALAVGLWSARGLPYVSDIGSLLAHRGVGSYSLSMSHFFDLTGPSFAALRTPATLALIVFALGPLAAWILRTRGQHFASTATIALTSAIFFVAAHLALIRFATMLSSKDFADTISELAQSKRIDPATEILIFGDQSSGSSIPFYLGHRVELVDGRSTSMLFGSTFPDVPHIFLTPSDLLAEWGHGARKIVFVSEERRDDLNNLLGPNKVLIKEASGKLLVTDRPLDP